MYKALVRSHLDYCGIIYHIPPTSHEPPLGVTLHHHMEMVEKTQYQAALAVTGAWQGTSRFFYKNGEIFSEPQYSLTVSQK